MALSEVAERLPSASAPDILSRPLKMPIYYTKKSSFPGKRETGIPLHFDPEEILFFNSWISSMHIKEGQVYPHVIFLSRGTYSLNKQISCTYPIYRTAYVRTFPFKDAERIDAYTLVVMSICHNRHVIPAFLHRQLASQSWSLVIADPNYNNGTILHAALDYYAENAVELVLLLFPSISKFEKIELRRLANVNVQSVANYGVGLCATALCASLRAADAARCRFEAQLLQSGSDVMKILYEGTASIPGLQLYEHSLGKPLYPHPKKRRSLTPERDIEFEKLPLTYTLCIVAYTSRGEVWADSGGRCGFFKAKPDILQESKQRLRVTRDLICAFYAVLVGVLRLYDGRAPLASHCTFGVDKHAYVNWILNDPQPPSMTFVDKGFKATPFDIKDNPPIPERCLRALIDEMLLSEVKIRFHALDAVTDYPTESMILKVHSFGEIEDQIWIESSVPLSMPMHLAVYRTSSAKRRK